MKLKKYTLLATLVTLGFTALNAGGTYPAATAYEAIIMFPSAPNPTQDKCLIRTYLPEVDPNSSIRILDKDSTLIKEIPLSGEVGIGSTPLNVADWKAGTYSYQLFYKGEARETMQFVVKH